jgi:hypothetical protein
MRKTIGSAGTRAAMPPASARAVMALARFGAEAKGLFNGKSTRQVTHPEKP